MLKPSATKTALQLSTEELVAQFKAQGGRVVSVETSVALGLKRRRYLGRKRAAPKQ